MKRFHKAIAITLSILVVITSIRFFYTRIPRVFADTSQVTVTSDTTTTNTTYEQMDTMSITPGAGDYLVYFSTSIKKSTGGSDQFISLYVNGAQITHTERQIGSDTSFDAGDISSHPISIQAYVASVGAGQAIEVRWKTSAGTATAHERTLIAQPVTASDMSQATATDSPTTTSLTDVQLTSMTLTPGAGDYIVYFSGNMMNSAASDTYASIYVAGAQVAHSERDLYTEASFTSTEFPIMTQAYVAGVGASDVIEVKWRTTAGTATASPRTLTVQKVTASNVSQATATADTTTTNTTDTQLGSMTLTPGVGTYLVIFSTSIKNTDENGSTQNVSLYVAGTQVAHSEREVYTEESHDSGSIDSYPVTTHAYLTDVGASDVIEVKWRTTAGTVTAHQRTLTVLKVADPSETTNTSNNLMKMDEGYGTSIHEENANLSAGTIVGATWKTNELCKTGNCLYLDGTGDYVSFADDADLNHKATDNFTLEGWFRTPDITSGQRTILAKYNNSAAGYKVYMDANGYVLFGIDDDTTYSPDDSVSTTSTAFDDNKWHQFAAVKTGTTSITLYIDGVQYQTDNSIVASGTLSNTDTFYIGIDGNGSSNGFNGFLDEIQLYGSARSASEIKADYLQTTANRGITASFGPDQSTLSNGLVGYWKMDEASWSNNCSTDAVLDASGNNNHGDACPNSTGPTGGAIGKFGNTGDLDGSDDYVLVADSNSLDVTTNFTISAWINADTITSGEYMIVSKDGVGTDTTDAFNFYAQAGGRICYETNNRGGSVCSSSSSIAAGSWYHVAVVFNDSEPGATKAKLFVNGVQKGYHDADITQAPIALSTNLLIGRQGNSGSLFDGKIDDVRIYNRSLSSIEVNQLYTWAPSPIMYFPFDENTGTSTVYDRSGSGYTGTLQGSMDTNDWVQGKYGSALNFDGVDDKIQTSFTQDIDGTAFSVGAWIKTKIGATGFGHIFGQDAYVNPTMWENFSYTVEHQWGHTAIYRDRSGTSSDWTSQDEEVVNGTWAHVMFTYDGSSSTNDPIMYVNGIPRTFQTNVNGSGSYYDSARNWFIGGGERDSYFFSGAIDEVKLYNYIRTPSQVLEDMNGGHPSPGSPVGSAVSHWKFDDGNGTTAYDSSINANNLTLSSASWTPSGKFGMAWNGTGSVWVSQAADDADHDFAASEELTLSAWIRSDSATNPSSETQYILKKGTITNTGTVGYAMYVNTSGNIVFGIKDDTAWGASSPTTPAPDDTVTSTSDLYDGQWHHIVATKNGTSSIDLYVDGKINASDTSLAATGTLANNQVLRLGDDDADATNSFAGNIDEVKIYRTALTADQIKVEYNRGFQASMGAGSQGSIDTAGTTGDTAPTSGANDAGYGSIAWSNPTNIYASENTRASVTLSGTTATNYLSASSFGFAIPSDATIVGITASIERIRNGGSTGQARDSVVSLVKSGTVTGNNKAATGTNWPTGEAAATYGSATDLWGTTWTPSDINASNFGLVVAAVGNTATTNRVANVDRVLINVAYTTPTTATEQSQSREYCVPGDTASCNPPLGHWKMDENTGTTAKDSSGNNYNSASFTGNPTWSPAKYGSALRFNGSTDGVKFSQTHASSTNGTFSAWIYPNAGAGTQRAIFASGDDAGTDSFLLIALDTADRLNLYLRENTSANEFNIQSTRTVSLNTWTHVTVTQSSSGPNLYINGVLDNGGGNSTAGTADGTEWFDDIASVDNTTIGYRDRNTDDSFFTGIIDDSRLYDYARTPAQIAWDMNMGKPSRWWKMDEAAWTNDCSTDSVFDSSGNAKHGDACPNSTGPVGGATGKYNRAGSFDGTNDYVQILSPSLPTRDFSYTAWFYMTDNSSDDRTIIMASDGTASSEILIRVIDATSPTNPSKIEFAADGTSAFSTTAIQSGRWTHVAFTRASGTMRIYINGALDPTTGSESTVLDFSTCQLFIGLDVDTSGCAGVLSDYFYGTIDDLRVYEYALTSQQISSIMNEGVVRFGPQTGSP
ncbi:LamG domain-containing protein [Candidatus Woesebacteria bacterium]|nr:LamG domain-containing protein [Candidatus Woesebacteria bacterium]